MQRFQGEASKAWSRRQRAGRAWRNAAVSSKQAGSRQELTSRGTLHEWIKATYWLRNTAHLHCSGGSKPDSHAHVFEHEAVHSERTEMWDLGFGTGCRGGEERAEHQCHVDWLENLEVGAPTLIANPHIFRGDSIALQGAFCLLACLDPFLSPQAEPYCLRCGIGQFAVRSGVRTLVCCAPALLGVHYLPALAVAASADLLRSSRFT